MTTPDRLAERLRHHAKHARGEGHMKAAYAMEDAADFIESTATPVPSVSEADVERALRVPHPDQTSPMTVERERYEDRGDGWQAEAEAQARALAERAGIDMLNDHDQFLVDMATTLIEFAEWANNRLLEAAVQSPPAGVRVKALDERDLYDADAFMADDGEHQMTAAENVLAWLLVEKCGVVDDVSYSPKKAQTILAWWLDRCNELENAKAAEIKEPAPSYWIVTWPGKDQGVHVAYKNLGEAEHAAKNIANYSTRKTETTIIPLYSALAAPAEAVATEPVAVRGPETEAVLTRDGFHLNIDWWRFGRHFKARIYEPFKLPISDALADVLALALEMRPALHDQQETAPARPSGDSGALREALDDRVWLRAKGCRPNGLGDDDLLEIRRNGKNLGIYKARNFNWDLWCEYRAALASGEKAP